MSLTPMHRSDEAAAEAMQEGLIAGGLVLAPTLGGIYVAMKSSPRFLKATNWQSRTAIAIMPALFAFGWTSEKHLEHKMGAIAQESQHHRDTVKWAEQQSRQLLEQNLSEMDKEVHLIDLYRSSVEESGVNVVPGDTLSLPHRVANYIYANPIKTLAGLAGPSVALIFYGNTGKEHLQLSTKILHTRVFGQFTTLTLMLSIMGFSDYMQRNGKFITEVEANQRVEEMAMIRQALMNRLDYEEQQKELREHEIALAHEEVMKRKHKAVKAQNNSSVESHVAATGATLVAASPAK